MSLLRRLQEFPHQGGWASVSSSRRVGVSPTVAAVCNRHAHSGASKAQQAALPKNGGGQNACATGGPGILPET